jgi:hypothetical protein
MMAALTIPEPPVQKPHHGRRQYNCRLKGWASRKRSYRVVARFRIAAIAKSFEKSALTRFCA